MMPRAIFPLLIAVLAVPGSMTRAQPQKAADSYRSAALQAGAPDWFEPFAAPMRLSEVRHVALWTGVDSLDVVIGSSLQGEAFGYWAALLVHHSVRTAQFGFGYEEDEEGRSAQLDLALDGARGVVIPLELRFDRNSETLNYRWLDEYGAPAAAAEVVRRAKPIEEGVAMPDFQVRTLDGQRLALTDFDGKTIVLNWWSVYCGPCVAELPGLNALVETYGHREDVVFLAISPDEPGTLETFFTDRPFDYRQTLSTESTEALFGGSYPRHVIIRPDGIVAYYAEGGGQDVHKVIEDALVAVLR